MSVRDSGVGRASPRAMRVAVEMGPKAKKVVAVALDWPGLERGATSEESALEKLRSYLPRYTPVARAAGLSASYSPTAALRVVERYPGTGSTDFRGISFAFSSFDQRAASRPQLEREVRLLRGCWAYFDDVRGRVSPEMRKGPRGGGRDRDRIVRHVLGVEWDWAKKLGLAGPADEDDPDDALLAARRAAYCAAISALHAEGKTARTWPLRYLIRHTAYHAMDHAWEMEDKDLTDGVD